MLRRRMLQAGLAITLVATSILGLGPAVNASPSSFNVKSVHANGAGAVGAMAVGGMTWYNRSVSLNSVRFYTAPGECGRLTVYATANQGSTWVTTHHYPSEHGMYCGGTDGWFTVGSFTLDGSRVYGGITEVQIFVTDVTHNGQAIGYCYRAYTACY